LAGNVEDAALMPISIEYLSPNVLTEKLAEIVDGLGNVAEVLNSADPSELAALYAALRLQMVYNAAAKIVGVSIRPTGRGSNRVRGGCVTDGGR
jgi:hypothetical protein